MKLIIKFLPGQIYNHPTFLQGAGAQTFTDYVGTICTHLIHQNHVQIECGSGGTNISKLWI